MVVFRPPKSRQTDKKQKQIRPQFILNTYLRWHSVFFLYLRNMEIHINSIETIGAAAQEFLAAVDLHTSRRRVFAFHGKMGAGKTTFIKALCEALEVDDVVNSPTFSIVNEYHSHKLDSPIFHFDFYRIKSLSEAVDIGTDDYFYSGHPCFIEWPELIADILPEDTVGVDIEEQADGRRVVRFAND